jgi:N-acetylmuramoyl-L-alanine amidase
MGKEGGMKKATCVLAVLVLAAGGCANYITTSELASRLEGRVESEGPPQRATVIGAGHEIRVESGTSVVFIDGKPIILRQPARLENGSLKVSDEIFRFLPPASPRVALTPPVPPPPPPTPSRYLIHRIVIDPGHGADNLGADYAGVREKNINLDIAEKLASELTRRGMQATLTRTDDTFIPLEQRSEIANAAGADLFVSIHANAARNHAASGIELYYLGETSARGSQYDDDVARADEMNTRNLLMPRSADDTAIPPSVGPSQLADWRQQSHDLAQYIEDAMVTKLGVESRGIKPQRYLVLQSVCSPAVLVEVGFLSNFTDRSHLADPGYRTRVALALADGILSYRQAYELSQPTTRQP